MSQSTEIQPGWVTENFLAFERALNGHSKSQIHATRAEAYKNFCRLGFPTTRNEDWKYTNVAALAKAGFSLGDIAAKTALSAKDVSSLIPAAISAHTFVFVDGKFRSDLSAAPPVIKGLTVKPLAEILYSKEYEASLKPLGTLAPSKEQAFVALNTAFLSDGAFIHVAKGAEIGEPIHFVFVSTSGTKASMSFPRVLVVAEEQSKVTLMETYVSLGDGAHFTDQVTEVFMGQGSSVDHYKLQDENANTFHYGSISATCARSCEFRTHAFSFGGRLVRNEVNPTLGGQGSVCVLNGLSVLRADQHVDNHTVIDHAKPHCESHELYKGIYADKSAGVFSGTIIVRPDAQKTNALQTNQSLLLSGDASIESKPQLKIWADDVKCTHGATVGQLDEHALFYLRSRGVPKKEARNMLIHAFASDVISGVRPPTLRGHLESVLAAKLESIGLVES